MVEIDIKQYEKKIKNLKEKINNFRPFDKFQLKNLQNWFNIAFNYNSNAIEGNTYTLQEVKVLIEDGITIGGKSIREMKEIQNYNIICYEIRNFLEKDKKIDKKFIINLYKTFLKDIISDQDLSGYRTVQVFITGEEKNPPSSPKEIEKLMKEYVSFINTKPENELEHIAKVHYDFVKIHPLLDGNGRIARLLMNIYFVKFGYLPIIIPKIVRSAYIESLNSSKNFTDFYTFFLWQTYENMKDYNRFFTK